MVSRYYISVDYDVARKGYRLVLGDLLTGATTYIDRLYDDYFEAVNKARYLVEEHSFRFSYCVSA